VDELIGDLAVAVLLLYVLLPVVLLLEGAVVCGTLPYDDEDEEDDCPLLYGCEVGAVDAADD